MKFEEAMKELDELLRQISGDDVPLDELLAKSRRGAELLKFCRGELDTFERKIEVLLNDDGKNGQWGELDENIVSGGNETSPRCDTSLAVKPSSAGENSVRGSDSSTDLELPF